MIYIGLFWGCSNCMILNFNDYWKSVKIGISIISTIYHVLCKNAFDAIHLQDFYLHPSSLNKDIDKNLEGIINKMS